MRALLLLALLGAPAAGADREIGEQRLKALRANLHNVFLRTYLHEQRGKKRQLKPAPGWIRNLGVRIAKNARQGLRHTWRFYTLDTPDVNAVTTPTGTIIILQGMLDLGLTRDELAALLAHEVAHLAHDHALKRFARRLDAAQLAALTARVHGRRSAQLAMLNSEVENLRFAREEEVESDLLGMELLRAASFPPEAMIGLLRKLNEHDRNIPAEKKGHPYMATHPPVEDRIRKAQAWLEAGSRAPARR